MKKQELLRHVGGMHQLGGIRDYTFSEGKQKGVRALEFSTGKLRFTVLPDRNMDIAYADYKGTSLSWMSKTGITAPSFYEPEGDNWHYGFYGGLLTTCGLRSIGIPCTHQNESFGLHGRISNIPASKISVSEDWEGDNYILSASGQMREAKVFSENLVLKRQITAKLGDSMFTIKDTIVNEGFQPEGFLILYHMNMGYPLVSDGAHLVFPKGKMTNRDPLTEEELSRYSEIHGPVHGYQEQCCFFDFEKNHVRIELQNPSLPDFKGIFIEYEKDQLPNFTVWKMLGESEYVVGLEPGTALPIGRAAAEEAGLIKTLQPMEEYHTQITFGILEK